MNEKKNLNKETQLNQNIIEEIINLYKSGKLNDAKSKIENCIKELPKAFVLYNILGAIFADQGKLEEAVNHHRKAVEINPSYAEGYNNLGIALQKLKQLDEAVINYKKALKLKPNFAAAYNNLGGAYKKKEKFEEAIENFKKAIDLKPDYFEAHNNLGATYKDSGQPKKAVTSCKKAIEFNPNYAEAFNNLGIALAELGKLDEAIESYLQALKIKPDYAEVHNHLGNTLTGSGKIKEAINSYQKALSYKPDYAEVYNNLGNASKYLGMNKDAINNYSKALELQPNHPEANFNESLVRLVMGEFKIGWKKYEFRWNTNQSFNQLRHQNIPLWLGKEELKNKKILVWSEQGYGDTIQFCRYIPKIIDLGAITTFEVPKNLATLVGRISNKCKIVTTGSNVEKYDFQVPLMSLPLVFNTDLASIPKKIPYLDIPSDLVKHWSKILGPKNKMRIGLAWSGRKTYKEDRFRSLKLKTILPIISGEFDFFCLQKDIREEDEEDLKKSSIKFVGDQDFLNTAAIIKNLDLVITVDSVMPHLSGAINFPIWLLLPFCPDWRWLLDRKDSPWYPSVKIFRQKKINDWENVIKIICDEIKKTGLKN